MKSKKRIARFFPATIVCAIITLPFSGQGGNPQLPEEEPKNLFDYIQKENINMTWQLWPGTAKLYEGSRSHGELLTTYVNDIAFKALKSSAEKFPHGSVIINENYSSDRNLMDVTAMCRVKGFNPEAGDWYWLKYDPSGSIQAEGKVASCINCHSSAKGSDWVFTEKP